MMNTVAPVWDGNETWLVLGGAALFGAFPLAYSVVLSALYLPLMLMLIGLIFRGVAFEFRFKAKDDKRHLWDKAFIGGSLAATFFQGVALGAFIDGFRWSSPVRRRLTGLADAVHDVLRRCAGRGLCLLGCTWLIMKTEGRCRSKCTTWRGRWRSCCWR
jgi:cytochrome d ubiquinol oxidase subunit II